MSEPADLAVFSASTLPPDTAETPWPRSPSGVPFMPMSGTYIVRFADGDATHTDGFLLVQSDGEPAWTSAPPP